MGPPQDWGGAPTEVGVEARIQSTGVISAQKDVQGAVLALFVRQ